MQNMNNDVNGEPNDDFLSLDNTGEYNLPEAKEIVLDLAKNQIRDTKDFAPIELIYLTAKEKGIKLKEFPVKNGMIDSGCRRPVCMGRGIKGWMGNIPIPCVCLFEKENLESEGVSINRNIIRNYHKNKQREEQYIKEKKMKEMKLRPIGNNVYVKIKKGTKEVLKYTWAKHTKGWNFHRINENMNSNVVDLDEGLVD